VFLRPLTWTSGRQATIGALDSTYTDGAKFVVKLPAVISEGTN